MKRSTGYTLIAALLLALGMASTLQAQDRPYEDKDDAWWGRLEMQFASALESPIPQVKVQTMRHIIFFAANYPDKVDMGLSVPTLLDIYDYAAREDLRVLALAAIDAVGDEYAMQHLTARVERETSARVHRLTMAVLAGYYGARDTG